jgi:hypothetical protein
LHLPADLSIISPNKWQKSNNFWVSTLYRNY